MAKALFSKLVAERGESQEWWIDSAGVAASEGEPATDYTKHVAAERGLDLSRHQSQPATPRTLERFSLILVMEESHRRQLAEAAPDKAGQIRLLSEMVGQRSDIWDPVGSEIENYRAMADQIDGILRTGFDRIRDLADQSADPRGEKQMRRPEST